VIPVAAVAVALAVVAGTPAPAWVPGEHGGTGIRITVENWGTERDVSAPGSAVYAHPAAGGTTTRVTVTVTPDPGGLHGFYGRLTAPEAWGGEFRGYCGDEFHRIESPVICGFDVPMSGGLNHLIFDLQSASFAGIRTQTGVVRAGALDMVPVLEARQADGSWQPVPAGGTLALPGERTSALRYRILNTGDLPFRAPESCQADGTVWPGQQLLCSVRGPRPVFALAGEYAIPVRLEDPVGGGASFALQARVVPQTSGEPSAHARGRAA
jgi:hypothetical protein